MPAPGANTTKSTRALRGDEEVHRHRPRLAALTDRRVVKLQSLVAAAPDRAAGGGGSRS